MKGRVSFNSETCKGCGLCVSVCPMKNPSLGFNQSQRDRL
jgi:Pyruvate/2-oxoacid:ferredoxin oxidoreductase delta subunit